MGMLAEIRRYSIFVSHAGQMPNSAEPSQTFTFTTYCVSILFPSFTPLNHELFIVV